MGRMQDGTGRALTVYFHSQRNFIQCLQGMEAVSFPMVPCDMKNEDALSRVQAAGFKTVLMKSTDQARGLNQGC